MSSIRNLNYLSNRVQAGDAMKATTSVITTIKKVFACPDCGSAEHEYEHLQLGYSFGPWYCDTCGCGVSGKVLSDGEIEIQKSSDRKANTLVLLRLNVPGTEEAPIHIVVTSMVFYPDGAIPSIDNHREEYFYEEHTCPWNYLRLPIKQGDDTDPHGVFVHQETILMPDGYDDRIDGEIDAWQKLFKTLKVMP